MKSIITILALSVMALGCQSTAPSNEPVITADAISASLTVDDSGGMTCPVVTVHATEYINITDKVDCRVTG